MTDPVRSHPLAPILIALAVAILIPVAHAGKPGPHDQARLRPKAVVPLMAKAPTIDGEIGAAEWPTLHVAGMVSQHDGLLQPRAGEFWLGSDGTRIYVAARGAVHPEAGARVHHPAREGTVDAETLTNVDSLEIYIAGLGANGPTYQIAVGPSGAIYDATYADDQAPAQPDWAAEIEQRHVVADGVWTTELAISCKSLGIEDITSLLGVRVCRNYSWPRDQTRWAPNVEWYTARATMTRVLFAAQAPVIHEVAVQRDGGYRLAVDLSNPSAEDPLPVTVRLGFNATGTPRDYAPEVSLTLAPGETKRVDHHWPLETLPDAPVFAEIRVKSARNSTVYHRDFGWTPTPPDALWDAPVEDPPAAAEDDVPAE